MTLLIEFLNDMINNIAVLCFSEETKLMEWTHIKEDLSGWLIQFGPDSPTVAISQQGGTIL